MVLKKTGVLMDSFVYDISDLYKAEVVIPVAFSKEINRIGGNELGTEVRKRCHNKMKEMKLLRKISKDLELLFGKEPDKDSLGLWDGASRTSKQGINYYKNIAH